MVLENDDSVLLNQKLDPYIHTIGNGKVLPGKPLNGIKNTNDLGQMVNGNNSKDKMANKYGDANDESIVGLIDETNQAAKVIVGPHGGVLTRENTIVPGCEKCSGGRLISIARVNWSPTFCCNRGKSPSVIKIAILLTMFVLSLLGIGFLCFTNFFNNTLLTGLVIKYNTTAYELWKSPPVHPILKIHILNYTNVNDVIRKTASKLQVEDIGPYVYKQTIQRVNEEFHENGTLTYQEKLSYQFLPLESVGTQFDNVTVPNLPLLSAISMVRESNYFAKLGISTVFKSLNTKPFRSLPIERFLWGYEDTLITLAQPYLAIKGEVHFDKFGILATRNGVLRDKVTINTGEKDLNKIGIIDRYNGLDRIGHWGTEECNRVDGTDGSIFPVSMIDGKQTLYVYNKELCRRFPMVFEQKVKVFDNIQAWRYVPPKDIFEYPSENPANQCYCHIDSGVCPPKGVFNSTPCAYGAPAFASFPHFYQGSPELLESIDGLNPDEDLHSSYLDIHPGLGIPLRASNKMQINIQIRRSTGITEYGFLPNDLILPVVWMDVTMQDLPQSIKTLVYHGTFSAHQIELFLMWTCIIMLLISLAFLLILTRSCWITRIPKF